MNIFQCENCGKQECQSGVFLDTKNVGEYPKEVSHSWYEKRLMICGNCTQAVYKILRDRINEQQSNIPNQYNR